MAVFNYKVVDRDGKNKKGTIEAPNRDGAEKKLKSEGYHHIRTGADGRSDREQDTEKGHSRCTYICRERWNSGGCAQS